MWSRLTALHHRLVNHGAKSLGEGSLLLLLIPLSVFYGIISWIRNLAYDFGALAIYKSSVSVISVGNLAAGGTGKTPVVDFLVTELRSLGYSVVILSRGYGGNFKGDAGCVSNGHEMLMTAACAGDEPFLLASRNPGIPVVIARQRKHGMKLIEKNIPGVDIIVLDDGFQHRSVARDCNIVLMDSTRPFGNGWPLPAGILREFSWGLNRADLVIFTRADKVGSPCYKTLPAFYAGYDLSDYGISLTGDKATVEVLKNKKLCAFAGIADPDSFFKSLEERGLKIAEHVSFRDHTEYGPEIVKSLQNLPSVDAFVTTEKDAVKLSAGMLRQPCYQIPLEVHISNKNILIDVILNRLNGVSRCQ